jgi:hypothetical protein
VGLVRFGARVRNQASERLVCDAHQFLAVWCKFDRLLAEVQMRIEAVLALSTIFDDYIAPLFPNHGVQLEPPEGILIQLIIHEPSQAGRVEQQSSQFAHLCIFSDLLLCLFVPAEVYRDAVDPLEAGDITVLQALDSTTFVQPVCACSLHDRP